MSHPLIKDLTRLECNKLYKEVLLDRDLPTIRELCLNDLFFFFSIALNRPDVNRPWLFDRIREIEANPNGHLDLWAREHYKTHIISYALTLQDILYDPEITVGLFSISTKYSKAIGSMIKYEMENNELLKELFEDVLYENPQHQSPSWSLDKGLIVKRQSVTREPTVGCFGFLQGLPTGSHFKLRVYDDVIDQENVTNPEMIEKSIQQWELSLPLGSQAQLARYDEINLQRYIGTRYHSNDPYGHIMKKDVATPRIYPATDDGTIHGEPVFLSPESWERVKKESSLHTIHHQYLQDPKVDSISGFDEANLRYFPNDRYQHLNLYLVCDPASAKNKSSDYTVMMVLGLGADRNVYIVDMIRDRLSLTERWEALYSLHRQYKPIHTGYEAYGATADLEYFEEKMGNCNYRFPVQRLGIGEWSRQKKEHRIDTLEPMFRANRVYLPYRLFKPNYENKSVDLTQAFINDEYNAWPVPSHDDMLDCLSRINDPEFQTIYPADQPANTWENRVHGDVYADDEGDDEIY